MREALDNARGTVDFFFRDDDAGWGEDRLWALLELFADNALPVDVAVIPRALTRSLATGLSSWAASAPAEVRFHQHGFEHSNHEPVGRNYEFGPSRAHRDQRRDIAQGRSRLRDLLGVVDPVFTPPWNRCTPVTAGCLTEFGFEVLSREARATPFHIAGLRELSVNIDWFAHHKHVRLSPGELGKRLARTVLAPAPVGIMFHHAAMDGGERRAAGDLLTLIARHPRARAHSLLSLAHAQTSTANPSSSSVASEVGS